MSIVPKITLFDISSKLKPQAWSPNTWKTRLALNYKRLPYKTIWVSYPDIEATVIEYAGKATGKHPSDRSKPFYTLPAILDENGEKPVFITDSWHIAEYLDEKYPERPVLPKNGKAMQFAFEKFWDATFYIMPVVLGPMPALLDDRGGEYFQTTRERWYGKPLAEISPPGPTRDGDWEKVKQGLDKIAKVLDQNGLGADWVAGGTEPTQADFVMVAELLWIKTVLSDEWKDKMVEEWNGGRWAKLLKNMEEWFIVH